MIRLVTCTVAALALLAELAAAAPAAPVNEAAKDPAARAALLPLGETVYKARCAACHGADLKGSLALHAPDLTDSTWLFSGDDLESGGIDMYPSDVSKTVLYGIRSGHAKTREAAVMPGFGPADKNLLTDAEIADVADFVLQVSGRKPSSPAAAARGKAIFADKGNCWDCHADDAAGNGAIGATDLTRGPWLYGGDRASLIRTIREGAGGVMPAFEADLTPREADAVSLYVFEKAAKPAP